MSKRLLAVPAVLAVGLMAGTSIAGAKTGDTLKATLSGSKEVGAKGKGNGTFSARVSGSKVCYTLTFTGAGSPAVAAHIHKGSATKNGGIVLDLKPAFKSGKSAKCVTPTASVLSAILKNPGAYYVNVHTKAKPAGTMRGQLHA